MRGGDDRREGPTATRRPVGFTRNWKPRRRSGSGSRLRSTPSLLPGRARCRDSSRVLPPVTRRPQQRRSVPPSRDAFRDSVCPCRGRLFRRLADGSVGDASPAVRAHATRTLCSSDPSPALRLMATAYDLRVVTSPTHVVSQLHRSAPLASSALQRLGRDGQDATR